MKSLAINQPLFSAITVGGLPGAGRDRSVGSWVSKNHEDGMERGAGPKPDDWAGLPFNDAGRAKALSFSQSHHLLCRNASAGSRPSGISLPGPFSLKIWSENDPFTGKIQAWVLGGWETRAPMTI